MPFFFGWNQNIGLCIFTLGKCDWSCGRKAHGPGPNSAASFLVCDRLAGRFLRFDSRRAQLGWWVLVKAAKEAASFVSDALADRAEPAEHRNASTANGLPCSGTNVA